VNEPQRAKELVEALTRPTAIPAETR